MQIRHQLAIVLKISPEDIPIVPCRIARRGFGLEFLDYLAYKGQKAVVPESANSEAERQFQGYFETLPPRHRLEIGMEQLVKFYEHLSLWHLPQVLYFIPMALVKYLTWVSFLALVAVLILGTVSYAALLLFLAHIVLLFRDLFWAPIPNYRNDDALDDRFVPEYKTGEEND